MEAEAISFTSPPLSSSSSSSFSTSPNSNDKSNRRRRSAFARLCRKLSARKPNPPPLKVLDLEECSKVSSSNSSSSSSSSSIPIDQLQRVFGYFDEDGDGRISPVELQNCVKNVGGELSIKEAEAAVASSDLDGDGFLGFEEFQKLMEGSRKSEDEMKKELQDAFAMYEMEGTGYITASSLRRMLTRLGEPRSVDDCKSMIRCFDLNGDGVLSFEEFAIMLR